MASELESEGVRTVVASSDPLDKARETAKTEGLSLPVGYGLDIEATAATLGAFYETRRGILHATGYLVRPDTTIAVASYSTGPIGRLAPEDVLAFVRFHKKKNS